jgi:hypothetical protein
MQKLIFFSCLVSCLLISTQFINAECSTYLPAPGSGDYACGCTTSAGWCPYACGCDINGNITGGGQCIVCQSHTACMKSCPPANTGSFCAWSNTKPVVAKHNCKVSDGCTNVCTCSTTKPQPPTLVEPVNNKFMENPTALTFKWNITTDWGEECAQTTPREYQICISSEEKADCGEDDSTIDTTGGGDTNRITINMADYAISSGLNYWKMRSRNKAEKYSNWTASRSFTVDSPVATISSFIVKNADSTTVNPDNTNYYHLCNMTFQNSSNRRQALFEVTFYDIYGGDKVGSANLLWNGQSFPLSLGATGATTRVGTVGIEFNASDNSGNTYPLEVEVTNIYGISETYSPAYLKVWDCLVDVSGSLYDGSSGQTCNNTGFTDLVDEGAGFSSLLYNGSSTADVAMTPILPASYGTSNLVWGYYYLPLFNGGSISHPDGSLNVSARLTRLIDIGTGSTYCPVNSEFIIGTNISPYSINPEVKVDFSFIRSQEGWFQVSGAGVKAKSEIGSGVPTTADVLIKALTIPSAMADNGLVSFSTYNNINGNNNDTDYGISNNWWINRSTNNSTTYSYQHFYNNFFVNKSIGETGINWDSKPSEGLYFVNGNLNIDSDLTLDPGKFLMVVVRGSITIAETVNRLDGIYVADGGITASGFSDTQLVINGMLYSRNNIRLSRSYASKILNNTLPATKVNYRPDLIFNMPGILLKEVSGWREE